MRMERYIKGEAYPESITPNLGLVGEGRPSMQAWLGESVHEVDVQCFVVALTEVLLRGEVGCSEACLRIDEVPFLVQIAGGFLEVEFDVCWFCRKETGSAIENMEFTLSLGKKSVREEAMARDNVFK